MNYGIVPDVVSTAKGLGGGLPIGATLLSKKVEGVFGFGDHGSTVGGNPVSCAGACYIIETLSDAFLAEVERKGKMLRDIFSAAPGIEAVTGSGLMIGLKTSGNAADIVNKCIEGGVLCLTAKDKVRLLPPLNTPDELLVKAAEIIISACKGE